MHMRYMMPAYPMLLRLRVSLLLSYYAQTDC